MFINRYEKHLFIITNKVEDFDKVGASDYIHGVSTQLNNIPKIINIDGYGYKLRGAIELKTSKNLHVKNIWALCIYSFSVCLE